MGLFNKLFGKKGSKEAVAPAKKMLYANIRYGVVTAYYGETLEGLDGGMIAPRTGVMIFTDDGTLPRTGCRCDLEVLADRTGRDLRWISEYGFYTLGRGMVTPRDDIEAYGRYVCPSLASAVAMSDDPPR